MTSPKKRPIQMDVSLAQFAAQIDEHVGRETGFETAVRDYRKHADLSTAYGPQSEARRKVYAKLDAQIDAGSGYVAGRQILAVRRGAGVRRALRSSVVKQRRPELWDASRVTQRTLGIKYALAGTPNIVIPSMRTVAETWAAYEHVKRLTSASNANVALARERLRAVAEEVTDVWNGELRVTADGWTVGWSESEKFEAGRCRQVAEARGIDLTPLEVEEHVAGSLVYVLAEPLDGAVDLDAD